jgi:hypothetical protein
MKPYLTHILLPTDDDIDGETIMEYIHDILVEGFDKTSDKVQVERDLTTNSYLRNKEQQLTISLLYEGIWRCRIHYNDVPMVLHDTQQGSELYESGHLIEDRNKVAQCYRRLDIVSDPDPHHDYYEEFYAISDYLQNILGRCYTFDPIKDRFRTSAH